MKNDEWSKPLDDYLRKFRALYPGVEVIGIRFYDDAHYLPDENCYRIDARVFCIELLDRQDSCIWQSRCYEFGKVSLRQALSRSLWSFRKTFMKAWREETK